MLNSFQEGVLVICCVNMIAVLGMSVLTGFTRLFSFGNAGFMSIGAYAAAICSVQFKFPFVLSILIGAAIAGIVSYILGSLTIRLRGDYFLISCLGFGECVRVLFNLYKRYYRRCKRLLKYSVQDDRCSGRDLYRAGIYHCMEFHSFQIRTGADGDPGK